MSFATGETMYKYKLISAQIKSESAARLQRTLLAYHDFRHLFAESPLSRQANTLVNWQTHRLCKTHEDLYIDSRYRAGLDFLFQDLYQPGHICQRDDEIDRIFPTMLKLLPESILDTVASLIELNHLTQELDLKLTDTLFNQLKVDAINEQNYIEAYPLSGSKQQRLHQIQLIASIGDDLDKYTRRKFLHFSLRMTQKPAEMAGLSALHDFLLRGFATFRAMPNVAEIMETIVSRETKILNRIFDRQPDAFDLEASCRLL
ncbi:MAG: hypothetical protein CSB48_13745 [Proteobacteria bacterium]|nr:MAG: hypothetical protein CSB48_13745 [Pseudomonadota bacterium]